MFHRLRGLAALLRADHRGDLVDLVLHLGDRETAVAGGRGAFREASGGETGILGVNFLKKKIPIVGIVRCCF